MNVGASVFICPQCRASLDDSWVCDSCGLAVERDVAGVAQFLPPPNPADDPGFDRRWREHPDFQASRGDFWTKTGWKPEQIRGKVVVEGGCGAGRYLDTAASAGARVVGVDIAPCALAASARNVPTATLARADLLRLPIADRSVDAAYSLGVLHHTPDPAGAFAELARTVKSGGHIAVWVYTRHISDDKLWPAFEFLHEVTRACPKDALYAACNRYAVAMRDAYAGRWDPLAQVVRASGSRDDEECVSDTFDWHTPRHRSWHTLAEVEGWFAASGCDVTYRGDFPVSVGGRKR